MQAIITINKELSHRNNLDLFTQDIQLLKIYGKEILLYYFELLNELKVTKIFILGKKLKKLSNILEKNSIFFPQIEFVREEELETFYQKKNFLSEDLIILENTGFIFNSFNKIKTLLYSKKESFFIQHKNFKISFVQKKDSKISLRELRETDILDIKAILNISDYIDVSNKLIKNLTNLDFIRGYTSNENLIIGKNVEIDESCILIKPLVILDNVKISKNCVLGPNTIISDNVYIENNTHIKNSIVHENVCISNNLYIDNKIVLKNALIDKTTFENFEIDDTFISKNSDFLSFFLREKNYFILILFLIA